MSRLVSFLALLGALLMFTAEPVVSQTAPEHGTTSEEPALEHVPAETPHQSSEAPAEHQDPTTDHHEPANQGPEHGLGETPEVHEENLEDHHHDEAEADHGEDTGHGETAAHGEDGAAGEHESNDPSLFGLSLPAPVWQGINLLFFMGILVYVLRQSAPAFFRQRKTDIVAALNQAEIEKAEAQDKLKAIEAKMAKLDDEVKDIEINAKREAQAEKEKALAEAEVERKRIIVMAKDEMDRRVKEGRNKLRAYAAELAAELASKDIKSSLSEADHGKLITEYAKDLEGGSLVSGK